jgi:hypothetical protein
LLNKRALLNGVHGDNIKESYEQEYGTTRLDARLTSISIGTCLSDIMMLGPALLNVAIVKHLGSKMRTEDLRQVGIMVSFAVIKVL